MGQSAKYYTEKERNAAINQRRRNSERKKEYDREFRRNKREQQRSHGHNAPSLNNEAPGSMPAELNGNIPQSKMVTPAADGPPVAEMYHDSGAWGGISTAQKIFLMTQTTKALGSMMTMEVKLCAD